MNLARRIAKLEGADILRRDLRAVLRFEGPGSETFPKPTQEEIERAGQVITIRFVEAQDGRPANYVPLGRADDGSYEAQP